MSDRKPAASKFAGIFQSAAPVITAATPVPERTEAPPPIARPLGRPHGKRSDPAWKQFSVLLKKQTQREAVIILRAEAEEESRDLSDLLQELLEQWIAGRRRV
jgi:hypothetical protein